jgi:hypothetical protein
MMRATAPRRVDDRREHAHVIRRDAIHAGLGEARAAKDVAAADHEPDLDAHRGDLGDLGGDALDDRRVDAILLAAEQRLAAQLQQYSSVGRRPFRHRSQPSLSRMARLTGP